MRLELVGGPYDGLQFDHPTPLPPKLELDVVESEEDHEFAWTVLTETGAMPSDDISPPYEKTEYRLAVRKSTGEPCYLFEAESHHGVGS